MKKTLLTLTACLLLGASLALGQTASISFNDQNGTLIDTDPADAFGSFASGTGTFGLDVLYTFSGGTSTGLSYWLETEAGTASAISITAETYLIFTNPQNSSAKPWPFTDTSANADSGFAADESPDAVETGDLGATGTAQPANTYTVSNLTISLSGLGPGTYHLNTTDFGTGTGTKVSSGAVALTDAFIPESSYTFTVVPEPATWSLMALGGLGAVGLNLLRARRKS